MTRYIHIDHTSQWSVSMGSTLNFCPRVGQWGITMQHSGVMGFPTLECRPLVKHSNGIQPNEKRKKSGFMQKRKEKKKSDKFKWIWTTFLTGHLPYVISFWCIKNALFPDPELMNKSRLTRFRHLITSLWTNNRKNLFWYPSLNIFLQGGCLMSHRRRQTWCWLS